MRDAATARGGVRCCLSLAATLRCCRAAIIFRQELALLMLPRFSPLMLLSLRYAAAITLPAASADDDVYAVAGQQMLPLAILLHAFRRVIRLR